MHLRKLKQALGPDPSPEQKAAFNSLCLLGKEWVSADEAQAVLEGGARTKQTARKSRGGPPPVKQNVDYEFLQKLGNDLDEDAKDTAQKRQTTAVAKKKISRHRGKQPHKTQHHGKQPRYTTNEPVAKTKIKKPRYTNEPVAKTKIKKPRYTNKPVAKTKIKKPRYTNEKVDMKDKTELSQVLKRDVRAGVRRQLCDVLPSITFTKDIRRKLEQLLKKVRKQKKYCMKTIKNRCKSTWDERDSNTMFCRSEGINQQTGNARCRIKNPKQKVNRKMKMANLTIDQRKKLQKTRKKKRTPTNKRDKKADEPEEEGLDNNDLERMLHPDLNDGMDLRRISSGTDAKPKQKNKHGSQPKTHCGISNIRCTSMTTERFNSLNENLRKKSQKLCQKNFSVDGLLRCRKKKDHANEEKKKYNRLVQKHEESIRKNKMRANNSRSLRNIVQTEVQDFDNGIFNNVLEKLGLFSNPYKTN